MTKVGLQPSSKSLNALSECVKWVILAMLYGSLYKMKYHPNFVPKKIIIMCNFSAESKQNILRYQSTSLAI